MSFTQIQKSDGPLLGKFDRDVLIFLGVKGGDISGSEVIKWLENSQRIFDQYQSNNSFYDYTFVAVPAFKALEKWILLISPFLGVQEDKIKNAEQFGNFKYLKEDNINSLFDEVIQKLNIIDQEKELNIKDHISSIYSLLKSYRHEYSHCSNIIDNVYKTEDKIASIRDRINSITLLLIKEKIINND